VSFAPPASRRTQSPPPSAKTPEQRKRRGAQLLTQPPEAKPTTPTKVVRPPRLHAEPTPPKTQAHLSSRWVFLAPKRAPGIPPGCAHARLGSLPRAKPRAFAKKPDYAYHAIVYISRPASFEGEKLFPWSEPRYGSQTHPFHQGHPRPLNPLALTPTAQRKVAPRREAHRRALSPNPYRNTAPRTASLSCEQNIIRLGAPLTRAIRPLFPSVFANVG
jgi:hypothetical protein